MATHNQVGFAVVGLGAVAVICYFAFMQAGSPLPMPEVEIASNGGFDPPMSIYEHFDAKLTIDGQNLVKSRHRYPTVTGGNISTLIHRGFSQLRLPAPQDRKWMECPPAEVMW